MNKKNNKAQKKKTQKKSTKTKKTKKKKNNFQPCSCILPTERGSVEQELGAEVAVFRVSYSDIELLRQHHK